MKIVIEFPHVTDKVGLMRVKRWDESPMPEDGFSVWARLVNGQVMGQFALVTPYIEGAGTFSANSNATRLTTNNLFQIADLQIEDAFTLQQKMNWLMHGGEVDANGTPTWGAPMRA